MDIVSVVGVVGTGVGILGLAGTLYQIHRRRESEQEAEQRREEMRERLDRKEELEGLSDELRSLNTRIQSLTHTVLNPRAHEDMELFLHSMGRDMLAYHHATGQNPTVKVLEVGTGIDESTTVFNTSSEMVEYYRQTDNSARVRATTWVRDDEKVLEHVRRSDIAQALNGVTWVRLYIEDIRSDYGDLLHQFDGSILDEIDGTLDRLVDACYSEIFEHAEGVEFIPDEYGNPVEMEDAVYETFMLSDEVRGIVKDLEKLGERVSDTQTDVVQTSFS